MVGGTQIFNDMDYVTHWLTWVVHLWVTSLPPRRRQLSYCSPDRLARAHTSNQNAVSMHESYQMDRNALLAVVRIQAALSLVPQIIGQKEDWVWWMRDNLRHELVSDLFL